MSKKRNIHEKQLLDILDNVQVIDEQTYSLDGALKKVYHQQIYTEYTGALSTFGMNERSNDALQKSNFLQQLTSVIYSRFYCGTKESYSNHSKMPPKADRDAFMEKLSKANQSTIQPDANWKIYSIQQGGNGFAEKNGQLRPVQPNTYVPNPQQQPLAINQTIQFYRQKENRAAQTVFYFVYGNEYLAPDCNMMRIYWNITPEGAVKLVEQVTTVLNDYRVPFHFKCLNHPDLYTRSDSAVLYFDKANITIVEILLKEIVDVLKPHFKEGLPYFTNKRYKGVSIAEDPGGGQSFGMSRSKMIADALYAAFEQKIDEKERFEFLKNALKANGIDSKQMAINPHTQHYLLRVA